MVNFMDKVHPVGMSESGSTHMTVTEVCGADGEIIRVEPPIQVIFEGEDTRVAVSRGGLAARYHYKELGQIGEGNSMLGLNNVIGEIAMKGKLMDGAVKPLHPNIFDAGIVSPLELVASQRELSA